MEHSRVEELEKRRHSVDHGGRGERVSRAVGALADVLSSEAEWEEGREGMISEGCGRCRKQAGERLISGKEAVRGTRRCRWTGV